MALEVASYISELVATNPVGATDPVAQGDDHIRLLKSVLQATFPALNAAVSATPVQLNQLNGGAITSLGAGNAGAPAYSFSGDTDSGMFHAAGNVIGFSTNATVRARISSVFEVVDGSAAAPAITFINDLDTGMFRVAGNELAFAVGGNRIVYMPGGSAVAFRLETLMSVPDGTVGAPAISFSNDFDSGIYRIAADQIGISLGGTSRMDMNAARTFFNTLQVQALDGSVAAPAFAFANDTDSGMYRVSANRVGISGGGTGGIEVGDNYFAFGTLNAGETHLNVLTATTASAGGFAMPATARGFWRVVINGTERRIPYFDTP